MSTYLIVDVANMAHRCLHVGQGTMEVRASMALHITLNSLRSSWKRFNADHIVFCLEGKSWRHDHYAGYKAQRRAAASILSKKEREEQELFFGTFDVFMEFIRNKTNATVLQCARAEADDMIARWIQVHPDDEHIIVSSDRDFFQLLTDKVKMYDGVRGWTISTKGYFDEDDKPVVVNKNLNTIDKASGKKIKKATKVAMPVPDPEYELFMKIVRGDASDNIMSAAPGAREHGSAKKPGIREAYDDRHIRGFNWNNFMLQEWDKLVGAEDDGTAITKRVRVIDEFNANKLLVDLTKQPDDVKLVMDDTIYEAVGKPKVSMVGVWFLRFTDEMGLYNIGKYPTDFANMLSAPYAT